MAYNDMPDVGTLGGTMQDAYGESSATLGGMLTPDQDYANLDWADNFWGTPNDSLYDLDPDMGLDPTTMDMGQTVNPQSFSDTMSEFRRSKIGRVLETAFGLTPPGRAFNMARGVYNLATSNDPVKAGFGLAGMFGGVPGQIANAAYQGSKGNFSTAGSVVGGLAGGSPGAAIGREIGGALSTGRGAPAPQGTAGGFNLEGLLGGLGQLYAANRADDGLSSASASNNLLAQQQQRLADMYSPNSPYAQQLRQTLERKDAAAGRRSQYGPREVQLQAALADKATGASESMARMAQAQQANALALNRERNTVRGQQLALLTNLGRQSGLFDMFKGAATPKLIPDYSNVAYDDSTWMGTE